MNNNVGGQLGVSHETDPEEYCYRDAISELKIGHVVYVYKESILKKILEKMPNAKVTRKEFYWKIENVESKLRKYVRKQDIL